MQHWLTQDGSGYLVQIEPHDVCVYLAGLSPEECERFVRFVFVPLEAVRQAQHGGDARPFTNTLEGATTEALDKAVRWAGCHRAGYDADGRWVEAS